MPSTRTTNTRARCGRLKASASKPPEPSRCLIRCGTWLMAWGMLHVAVWLASGTAWQGDVSWRKPILFGLSGGITLVSMGFLTRLLKSWPVDLWIARIAAASMSLEVALISLQQWRGVPSHFNRTTPLNHVVDLLITLLILVVTCCIVLWAARAFRFLKATADEKIAWRGGLAFLLVSGCIGFAIYVYGSDRVATGDDPTTFGDRGAVKFPHGVVIHAIQLLPALCWLMTRLRIPTAKRVRAVWALHGALACVLAYSVVQTLAGRGRVDFTVASACLLGLAMALMLPIVLAIAKGCAVRMKWTTMVTPQHTP